MESMCHTGGQLSKGAVTRTVYIGFPQRVIKDILWVILRTREGRCLRTKAQTPHCQDPSGPFGSWEVVMQDAMGRIFHLYLELRIWESNLFMTAYVTVWCTPLANG